MAIVRFNLTIRNNILSQVQNGIDSGSGAGYFDVYTAPMPAKITDAETGTKLGRLTFSDSCSAGPAVDGTDDTKSNLICAPAPGITQDASADNDGVAAWARCYNSAGVAQCDVDVTNTGGGGALQLNTTNIKALGPIIATSFKFYV